MVISKHPVFFVFIPPLFFLPWIVIFPIMFFSSYEMGSDVFS